MKIQLWLKGSFGDSDLSPSVDGDIFTYRGKVYDFSPLPEGAEIPVGSPFLAPVKRKDGKIHVEIEYFYNLANSADDQVSTLEDCNFDVISGQCPCPIIPRPKPAAPAELESEDIDSD